MWWNTLGWCGRFIQLVKPPVIITPVYEGGACCIPWGTPAFYLNTSHRRMKSIKVKSLRDRDGLITISSIIVACETRLTESGIPPEPSVGASLIS